MESIVLVYYSTVVSVGFRMNVLCSAQEEAQWYSSLTKELEASLLERQSDDCASDSNVSLQDAAGGISPQKQQLKQELKLKDAELNKAKADLAADEMLLKDCEVQILERQQVDNQLQQMVTQCKESQKELQACRVQLRECKKELADERAQGGGNNNEELVSQILQSRQQLEERDQELMEMTREFSRNRAKLRAVHDDTPQMSEHEELIQSLEECQQSLAERDDELAKSNEELKLLQDYGTQMMQKQMEADNELDIALQKVSELQERLDERDTELTQLANDLSKSRVQLRAAQDDTTQMSEHEELIRSLEESQQQLKERDDELAKSRAKVQVLQDFPRRLESTDAVQQLEECKQQLEECQQEVEKRDGQLAQVNTDMTLLQDYGVQMMDREAEAEEQLKAADGKLAYSEQQLDECNSQLQSLRDDTSQMLENEELILHLAECQQELKSKDKELAQFHHELRALQDDTTIITKNKELTTELERCQQQLNKESVQLAKTHIELKKLKGGQHPKLMNKLEQCQQELEQSQLQLHKKTEELELMQSTWEEEEEGQGYSPGHKDEAARMVSSLISSWGDTTGMHNDLLDSQIQALEREIADPTSFKTPISQNAAGLMQQGLLKQSAGPGLARNSCTKIPLPTQNGKSPTRKSPPRKSPFHLKPSKPSDAVVEDNGEQEVHFALQQSPQDQSNEMRVRILQLETELHTLLEEVARLELQLQLSWDEVEQIRANEKQDQETEEAPDQNHLHLILIENKYKQSLTGIQEELELAKTECAKNHISREEHGSLVGLAVTQAQVEHGVQQEELESQVDQIVTMLCKQLGAHASVIRQQELELHAIGFKEVTAGKPLPQPIVEQQSIIEQAALAKEEIQSLYKQLTQAQTATSSEALQHYDVQLKDLKADQVIVKARNMKLSEELGRARQQVRVSKKELRMTKEGSDSKPADSTSGADVTILQHKLQETVRLLKASQEAVLGDNQLQEQNHVLQQQIDKLSKQLKEVTSQAWQSRQQVDSLSAELRSVHKFEDAAKELEASQAEAEIKRLGRDLADTHRQLKIAIIQPGLTELQEMLTETTEQLEAVVEQKEFNERQWAHAEQEHVRELERQQATYKQAATEQRQQSVDILEARQMDETVRAAATKELQQRWHAEKTQLEREVASLRWSEQGGQHDKWELEKTVSSLKQQIACLPKGMRSPGDTEAAKAARRLCTSPSPRKSPRQPLSPVVRLPNQEIDTSLRRAVDSPIAVVQHQNPVRSYSSQGSGGNGANQSSDRGVVHGAGREILKAYYGSAARDSEQEHSRYQYNCGKSPMEAFSSLDFGANTSQAQMSFTKDKPVVVMGEEEQLQDLLAQSRRARQSSWQMMGEPH